jgi:hypothetical protein
VLAENSSSKRVAYRVSVFCSTKFRVIVVKRCRGMGANFNNATPSRPAAPVVYTVAVAELSGCWIGACRGVYYSHSYFGKLCDFRWDRCIGLLCVGSVRTHMRNSATALPLSIQTITKMAGASSHAEINVLVNSIHRRCAY